MSRREKGRNGPREKDGDRRLWGQGKAGIGVGETRGARDDWNHVAIYLSRESGHSYHVKFS